MIEIKNCTVTYAAEPNHRVLKDISLTIEDGEFVLLTGESGLWKNNDFKAYEWAYSIFL